MHKGGGSAWMHLFLALAHQRLGHVEEARRWLARTQTPPLWTASLLGIVQPSPLGTLLPQAMRARGRPEPARPPMDWEDRLVGRLLHHEAEELLQPKEK